MGRVIIDGKPPITVTLRRSLRARRMSLRVSRLDGRVTLTLPQFVAEREGMAFLRDREGWLRGQVGQVTASVVAEPGARVGFEGRELLIAEADQRRVTVTEGQMLVPRGAEKVAVRVRAYLRHAARDRLAAASDRHAAALGLSYAGLSLRDTRSRWGSCSSRGRLMYSWRLIMAPPEVLDYVAAHEVAHLAEMNHSPEFWAVVERLFPEHRRCRQWLRDNGDQLHRLRFDD